jgi:hypothetical protein
VFDKMLDTPRDDGTMTPRHFILVAPTPTSEPDDEDGEDGDGSDDDPGDVEVGGSDEIGDDRPADRLARRP